MRLTQRCRSRPSVCSRRVANGSKRLSCVSTWRWIRELAKDWSCTFVFASGSLAHFWQVEDIVGDAREELPDLVPPELVARCQEQETRRVRYVSEGLLASPDELARRVIDAPGPRLLIMNTVQNAAVMAQLLKKMGHDVLHLSTALCPRDRTPILKQVIARLDRVRAYPSDWTLVATSLMEAGVDVSFRTAFRERFGVTSLIQVGGRTNRDFEENDGGCVHDFIVDGLARHPEATTSADVLGTFFANGEFDGKIDPAALVTRALRRQLRIARASVDHLGDAERAANYPDVASLGRIIDADTRLVVVDTDLRQRLLAREKISNRDLLSGSVQIWSSNIDRFDLEALAGREGLYWWPFEYDPTFLGYMAGVLKLHAFGSGAFTCI